MRRFLFMGLALWVVVTGCGQEPGKPEQTPIPVRVFVVHPDSISNYLYLTGTLESAQEALVYARVSERLEEIRVRSGQRVTAGTLLGRQEAGVFWQGVQQARAALQAAETRLKLAEKEHDHSLRLFQQGALTRRQYDRILAQYQQARAAWQQAQAAWRQAEEQYRNAELRAPIQGEVASIYYEVNDFVTAGQPVFRLVNPGLMKAWLYLPEKYLRQVHLHQPVTARFPSLDHRIYRGAISRIDRAVDPLSRTITLEVVLNNGDGQLVSGLFGRFGIELAREDSALVIPEHATLSRTELILNPGTGVPEYHRQYYVYLVRGGRARLQTIEVGIRSHERVQVTRGLHPGDSLIVVGQRLVKAGSPVRVVAGEMQNPLPAIP